MVKIFGKRGEMMMPCQGAPQCSNLVGKSFADKHSGHGMCPDCQRDYDDSEITFSEDDSRPVALVNAEVVLAALNLNDE